MSEPVQLKIKVVPGAATSQLCGWLGDILKIRVNAPPEKGKANKEVERLLAETFSLPVSNVQVAKGKQSPYKTVLIIEISHKEIVKCLEDRL